MVVAGSVVAFDKTYRLRSVQFPDGASCLRVVHDRLAFGTMTRLAVKARDVRLTLVNPRHSSIVNVIPVCV